MYPSEWEQQRDWEEWNRIMSMSPEELDEELRRMGWDPEEVRRRAAEAVERAKAEVRRRQGGKPCSTGA